MRDHSAPVSSITITLNEEDKIEDCLTSVKWCDEHIVIDNGSDDATVEIAESCGAQVFQMETPSTANSFEILRREAINQAKFDWILRIDADERSHDTLNRALAQIVGSDGIDVVEVPRMNYVGDDWMKTGRRWWPDREITLFKKKFVQIGDKIHSGLQATADANVVQLPENENMALYHYSYESLIDLLRRDWKYTSLEAQFYDERAHVIVYLAISDIVEGLIVDRGFTQGYKGVIIPFIDALGLLILLIKSHYNRLKRGRN